MSKVEVFRKFRPTVLALLPLLAIGIAGCRQGQDIRKYEPAPQDWCLESGQSLLEKQIILKSDLAKGEAEIMTGESDVSAFVNATPSIRLERSVIDAHLVDCIANSGTFFATDATQPICYSDSVNIYPGKSFEGDGYHATITKGPQNRALSRATRLTATATSEGVLFEIERRCAEKLVNISDASK